MTKRSFWILVCFGATRLLAENVGPVFVPQAIGERLYPPSLRTAERSGASPLVTLASAFESVPEEVAAIRAWNERGTLPTKNGFTRRIGSPIAVRVRRSAQSGAGVALTERGTVIWSGNIRVNGAYRFRLHLKNVILPPGAVFWVYGKGETPIAFDGRLIDESGSLYTPSVGGDVAYLELEVPAEAADASFTIEDILEIVGPARSASIAPNDAPTCLIDATCVTTSSLDVIAEVRRAIAHLQYVKSGSGYVCSGGLLNDKDATTLVPYLLTANHCFEDQSAASSVEAFWDYRTATCTGTFPDLSTFPRTNGSTLLATSATSDFTFVRMNSIPGSRFFLGWTTTLPPSGTILHRVSHPFPDAFSQPAPQVYSSTLVDTVVGTCNSSPRGDYIYSTGGQSGVYGGSSGSPVILAGGLVVGQLKGSCGPDPSAGCDVRNSTLDGAFAATFPSIESFISATTSTGQCIPNSTTACMLNNRFRTTVRFRGAFDNANADTDALSKTVSGFSNPSFETSFFYFNDPNNIEMMVKLLDQGNTNSAGQRTIAVLFGSATPLRVELTIADMQTGATKRYTSEFSKMQGTTEFTAFVK